MRENLATGRTAGVSWSGQLSPLCPLSSHLRRVWKERALAKGNMRISAGQVKGYLKASSYSHSKTHPGKRSRDEREVGDAYVALCSQASEMPLCSCFALLTLQIHVTHTKANTPVSADPSICFHLKNENSKRSSPNSVSDVYILGLIYVQCSFLLVLCSNVGVRS